MNLELSDLTLEFQDYVTQFEADLRTRNTIRGFLTTQTSQTLLELVATVGTLSTATLLRRFEDLFLETAMNDSAIYAIAQMQGLRIQRKTPSSATVTLQASSNTVLPKWTQFQGGGTYFFSREAISLTAGIPQEVILHQGFVVSTEITGLGTDFQSFITTEDGFNVSDVDVEVELNGVVLPRITEEGLWTRENQEGYVDSTLSDGRLIIQFGSQQFATVPQVDDVVTITYAITSGSAVNNQPTVGKRIQTYPTLSAQGTIKVNPSGGVNERPVLIYKNIPPGAFGSYTSSITLPQYKEIAIAYPDKDIRDVLIRPGKDANSEDHPFMNVVMMSILSDPPYSTWSQPDEDAFVEYMEQNTMYSTKFAIGPTLPALVQLNIEVYCKNSANLSTIQAKLQAAIGEIFVFKEGSIGMSLYQSDIIRICNNAVPQEIEYIKFLPSFNNLPVYSAPMQTTNVRYSLVQSPGALTAGNYAYCVQALKYSSEGWESQSPANWTYVSVNDDQRVQLNWDAVPGASYYDVYGGLANANGDYWVVSVYGSTSFVDDGSLSPNGALPQTQDLLMFSYLEPVYMQISVKHAGRAARQV